MNKKLLELGVDIALVAANDALSLTATKFALSFFNPVTSLSYGAAAATGLIAGPIYLFFTYKFPELLNEDANDTLPKKLLKDSLLLVIRLKATLIAAALIGAPILPSIACAMIIPVLVVAITYLVQGIKALKSSFTEAPADMATINNI